MQTCPACGRREILHRQTLQGIKVPRMLTPREVTMLREDLQQQLLL